MLSHFEKVISSELFDIGIKPLFTYSMAPGKELRDALSSFLRSFHLTRSSLKKVYLFSGCKVEVQTGEKTKVFFQMLNALSESEAELLLSVKKELEEESSLKMVFSKHNNRIGLLESNKNEVEAHGDRPDAVVGKNVNGGVDA